MHTSEQTPCAYLAAHRPRDVTATGPTTEIEAISPQNGGSNCSKYMGYPGRVYETGMRLQLTMITRIASTSWPKSTPLATTDILAATRTAQSGGGYCWSLTLTNFASFLWSTLIR
jgi:hypothetical protein